MTTLFACHDGADPSPIENVYFDIVTGEIFVFNQGQKFIVGGGSIPGASVRNLVGQTFTNGASAYFTFERVDWDSASLYQAGSLNAPKAGRYLLTAVVNSDDSALVADYEISMGAYGHPSSPIGGRGTAHDGIAANHSIIANADEGDFLFLQFAQYSGSSQVVYATFQAQYLGPA